MKDAAMHGQRWIKTAGALGLVLVFGGAATAADHPADCKTCQSYYGQAQAAGHVYAGGRAPSVPADYPRGADGSPMVYERQGLVDRLLGRKHYSIPLYHQTAGEKPVPLYPAPNGNLLAATPAPAAYVEAPMTAPYAPDAVPAVAYGEPAPIGVMRTDYQAMAAEAAARSGAMGSPSATGGTAPTMPMGGLGAMPGQPKPHDPAIDLWHTKMRSGGSMVAGGEKKDLLTRLTDGESPLDRWREARRTRKSLRAYGTLKPAPMGGTGMGPGR